MGSSGLGRSTGESFPILYTSKTKTSGGSKVTATQNIPFELIRPAIQSMTVPGTHISAQMRTISGASLDGTETPFEDQGFESITLGENNVVSTPRIIASRINETNNLSTLPGNKSFNMRLNLTTASSKLSPVIDSQRMSAFFTSNRVNNAISNYVTDNRVNTIDDDPTAFQYLSKEVQLENPGTSIKILLNAYLNTDCDIRAFYAISNSENFTPIYLPFPGFNNLNDRGEIINQADNDGRSDTYVVPTANEETLNLDLEFKERSFTMNDLPSFRFYRVKILMTSTNQVYVPRMKDLRVLALA